VIKPALSDFDGAVLRIGEAYDESDRRKQTYEEKVYDEDYLDHDEMPLSCT